MTPGNGRFADELEQTCHTACVSALQLWHVHYEY